MQITRNCSGKCAPSMERPRRRWSLEPLESRYLLAATPIISEFMADNGSTLADGNGQYSDWVEIYNLGDATADLAGWYLTDDPEDLVKWPLPDTSLAADDYLLVFASAPVEPPDTTPSDLPVTAGLQLHLNASDVDTVEDFQGDHPGDAGFTGNVKLWHDQSGNGYFADAGLAHAAVYATDGLDGGTPVLRFNAGGTRSMTIDAFAHGGDETIFAVFSAADVASGQLFNSNGNPTGGTYVVGVPGGGAGTVEGRVYANNVNSGLVTGPITAGAPYLYTYVFDDDVAGGAELFLNGVLNASADTNPVGTTSATAHLGNHPAELIVYDGALSDLQRQQVAGYLNDKYGLYEVPLPSISVNLQLGTNDNNGVDADEWGGVVPVGGNGWNQILTRDSADNYGVPTPFITGSTGGNSFALKDDQGNPVAAELTSTLAAGGGYTNWANVSGAGVGATGDAGVLQSYLNFGGTAPGETLTVSGLGSEFTDNGYEVYLYFGAGAAVVPSRQYGWSVGGTTVWGDDDCDNSDANDNGIIEWKRAQGTSAATANSANYAVFTGLSDPSFTISAQAVGGRATLNGFQIVAVGDVPETTPGRTVLVDFGKAGQETDPNGAEQWNDVTAVAADSTVATDLEDTAGADTGIDLYFGAGTYLFGVGGWNEPNATATGFPISATQDGIVIYGGTGVYRDVQLRDLDDSKLYELTFYA